ncbi:ABC transporter substrate-binding protein [Mesorhizobium sp. M6A.T.Cr.TU.017.01.1.1]|uniref:ABC transporter substrate-binding protein n=1 Tax=Mesorhizobium sp. M6A.T.Cr.TU.017.01.1.1 TaxID=2496774 RepID=UPI000FD236A2|nr:ABC transporter substrate-binding protein [Mesorhizobium sp. M6A.T.Cr.TU.017.01.1.1]RUV01923.1 ABC transporter substrate-binding protein [Mesorhizobium sp. M6A.T.Cr.TU.017.01.1.1]
MRLKTSKSYGPFSSGRRPLDRGIAVSSAAALGAILVVMPVLDRASAEGKTLTIQTGTGQFADCLRTAYYEPFEKATGIKILTAPENLDNSKFKLQVQTRQFMADVQWTDSSFAQSQDGNDYLEPIDYSRIPKEDLIPGLALSNAAPFDTYATVLAYNSDKTEGEIPTQWSDFFDLKKFPGKRGVANLASSTIMMALMADGVAPNDIVPFDYDRAFKKLDSIKGEMIFWDSGSQVQDLLASGEASLAMAFANRVDAVKASGKPVGMVWSGSLIGTDFLGVPKGNPNAANAMQYISYVLSKEVNGRLTDCIATGPVNTKARVNPKWQDLYPTSHLDEPHIIMDDPQVSSWLASHANEIDERFQQWKSQ